MSLFTNSTLTVEGVTYEFYSWSKNGVRISTNRTPTVTISGNTTFVAKYKKSATQQSFVAQHGNLSVSGRNLVDKYGNVVQLRGISSHGMAWYPQYINYDSFNTLKSWGANFVRLVMITNPNNGYDPSYIQYIKNGIDYATSLGMYVLIDWHVLGEGDPNIYIDNAKYFFDSILSQYKGYNNILYEICNEPNNSNLSYDVTWDGYIKPYAEEMIDFIRGYDSDCIIIVGTPTWSQRVDEAAANPITGEINIMYTLHFYAGTHKDWLRGILTTAYNAGLPIFVTEFGICNADSCGAYDYDSGEKWMSLLDNYQISYDYWTLNNNSTGESSAMIKSTCSATSGWTNADLTDGGIWIKNVLMRHISNEIVASDVVSVNLTSTDISSKTNLLSGVIPTVTKGSDYYYLASTTISNSRITSGELTNGVAQSNNSHIDVTSGLSSTNHLFIYFVLPSTVSANSFLMSSGNWLGAYNTQSYKVYVSDTLSGTHLFRSNPIITYTNSNDTNATGSQLFGFSSNMSVKYVGIEIIDPSAANDDSMSRISEIGLYLS